ncbi:uncharacterized protein LOC144294201 [Canis aureus]
MHRKRRYRQRQKRIKPLLWGRTYRETDAWSWKCLWLWLHKENVKAHPRGLVRTNSKTKQENLLIKNIYKNQKQTNQPKKTHLKDPSKIQKNLALKKPNIQKPLLIQKPPKE